jgi:hypothetical protein
VQSPSSCFRSPLQFRTRVTTGTNGSRTHRDYSRSGLLVRRRHPCCPFTPGTSARPAGSCAVSIHYFPARPQAPQSPCTAGPLKRRAPRASKSAFLINQFLSSCRQSATTPRKRSGYRFFDLRNAARICHTVRRHHVAEASPIAPQPTSPAWVLSGVPLASLSYACDPSQSSCVPLLAQPAYNLGLRSSAIAAPP